MLYKTRFLHLDLNTLAHSVGETSSGLMDASLSKEQIADLLIRENNGHFSNDDLILLNMPYDAEQQSQGWIITKSEGDAEPRIYPYPERFANALHRSTFDYVIITGKAAELIYVYLSDMLVLFEDPELIKNLKPALAAEKLVGNHPWVEPEVMISGDDSSLHFVSDKYSLPRLGAILKAKKMVAMVVDGTIDEAR